MLAKFIQYLETERRYSPLTISNYRRDIEAFLSWCEIELTPEKIQSITSEDVREWIVYRTETGGIAAASMNREISSIRSLFRWLRRASIVENDICRAIPSLRTSRRLPAFVPESRMEEVIERCDVDDEDFEQVRNALILIMFYSCGIRLAELISIDCDSFYGNYTSLKVEGKGGKQRIVPIISVVKSKILRYLDIINSQNICKEEKKALFLNRKGERISRSMVYRIVTSQLQSSGVQGKSSPHVLRHTFATHLLNSGADMREIQELLGHASLQTTQIYTHNSIATLREIYSKAHPRERDE